MSDRRQVKRDLAYVEDALRRWDPIGIRPGPGEEQGPIDEYDSYAPQVLGLLQRGADALAIERHLGGIRTDSIGLEQPNPEFDRPIAEDLVAWWRSRSDHEPAT